MTEQRHYAVRLENIPDTEQLIFKLIFSIAAKAKGREYIYDLTDGQPDQHVDIQISTTNMSSVTGAPCQCSIRLVDRQAAVDPGEHVILRPLIATRVLSILDKYCSEQLTSLSPVQTVAQTATSVPLSEMSATATDIDFCISEEEASQLAIVADETLANPANRPDVATAVTAGDSPSLGNAAKSNLLSFHRQHNIERLSNTETQTNETRSRARPRVLVVDDSASVRKQLELELQLFDVDMDFADSMAQSTQHLNNSQYDVAFLDVVLPDGDGFQICKQIKQANSKMKVIMLTGKASPADKIKGTMAGCDAYLVKPVGRMTFQNTVCNYLKLKNQNEAINA